MVLAHVRAQAQPYAARVLIGDLAMGGRAAAYTWLATTLAPETVPLRVVPGNHDDPAVLAQAAPSLQRELPWPLTLGTWRLLGLDTRIAEPPYGGLGGSARAWLVDRISTLPAGTHAGVIMHHPPFAIGSPWLDPMGLLDATQLWSLLRPYPALRLITCGHVQQNFDHYRGEVRILTTPSTCVQFAPRARHHTTDARSHGYRIIHLHDDGRVDTAVIRVPLSARSCIATALNRARRADRSAMRRQRQRWCRVHACRHQCGRHRGRADKADRRAP